MAMTRQVIVGIGETLWDVFPDGPRFGGAPANFACSAAELGRDQVEVWMASAVGQDELGTRALAAFREHGVNTGAVATLAKPSGQVLVQLDAEGRASYRFAEDTAWDNLDWTAELERLAARTDAVCFGTLGQRSPVTRATIQRFVSAVPERALRILDINLRTPFFSDEVIHDSLQRANILKLNDEELPALSRLYGLTGSESERMAALAGRFELRLVALTRGPRGAVLMQGSATSELPGSQVEVRDTVGAGDAFTAALTVGLLQGLDLATINRRACQVAAYVCTQAGATPSLPARLWA